VIRRRPGVGRQRLQRGAPAPRAGVRWTGAHRARVHPCLLDAPDHQRRPRARRGSTGTGAGRGRSTSTAADVVEQVRAHRPDVVFLCSPNNPTGTALDLDTSSPCSTRRPDARHRRRRGLRGVRPTGDAVSALSLLEGRPRLVVTRTMSKAFALAGGGLGYLAAAPVPRRRAAAGPDALPPRHPTQAIALAALGARGACSPTVEAIKAERDRIVDELAAHGAPPVPSDANFVLFGGLADALATWSALLERRASRPRRRHRPPSAGHRRHAAGDHRLPRRHGDVPASTRTAAPHRQSRP
jgi:hypothetical protein